MSSKVIKEDRTDAVFKMREFSTVERGEKDYNIRSFADDEELSIQDMFSDTGEDEPDTIDEYEDEVTDKDYWPPSRLAKAEDGVVGEKIDLPEGKLGQGFVEAPMFTDELEDAPKQPSIIRSRNNENQDNQESSNDDLPGEDVPVMEYNHSEQEYESDEMESPSIVFPASDEFIADPNMSPLISESELESLKQELQSYKDQIDSYKTHAEEMEALKLTVEKALMERDKQLEDVTSELTTLKDTLPEQLEKSKEEGRQEGYENGKLEFEKQYEADKADYLSKLEGFYSNALSSLDNIKKSIDEIDEQIPSTVVGFVKTLIGEERKINDNFALNLVKQNLSRLHEFRDIKFKVNPEDLEVTKQGLPDYEVTGDISIPKGAVIVESKSGEITLSVDTMIKDLENEINAQLESAEISKSDN